MDYYKIVAHDRLDHATDSLLVVGRMTYRNPGLALLHKLGYWPLDPDMPELPPEEGGFVVFDDGFVYKDDGAGGKVVSRAFRRLEVVDPGYPSLTDSQEMYSDEWVERDGKYVHVVRVLDIVDDPPVVDEETHHLKSKSWRIDLNRMQKIAEYKVVRRVDECPPMEDGEELVEDYWDYDTVDDEEVYRRFFRIMKVVRDMPEPKEDEVVVAEWYDDDEETNTRTWHRRILRVVDVPPTLEDGQQIVEDWWEDDEEAGTRTHRYSVRRIVDEPPVLEENDTVECEWWDDDGITRTHRYEVHRRIDVPPVLAPGQDIVSDRWEVVDDSNPYLIVHKRVYEVRLIVDELPELDESHFVNYEWWDDDGITRTHRYDVWELRDDPRPEVDETENRVTDLGIVDDPENHRRGRQWLVRPIVRNKPEDDPDGDFKWVEDGEEDLGDRIEIKYRRVDKVWRRISKLALESALFKLGLLDRFDAFIDSIEIENDLGQKVKARRFYDQANELRERHPLFKPYYAAGLKALGLTEDEGDALLDQCVAE